MKKIKSAIKLTLLLIICFFSSQYFSHLTTKSIIEFKKEVKAFSDFEEDLILYMTLENKFSSK